MSVEQLFGDLAAAYQVFRPRYPDAVLDWLRRRIGRAPETIVDVGAGTGILTRQLAYTFPSAYCIGIDPSAGMLETARANTDPQSSIHYLEAPAEELPLFDRTANLMTVGQALHWFDRPRFYDEAARTIAPGGWLAILYNDRDPTNALVRDYEALTMTVASDAAIGEQRANLGLQLNREGLFRVELHNHADFGDVVENVTAWPRQMFVDDFLGLCLSTATLRNAMARDGEVETLARVRAIAQAHADDAGLLVMPYVTTVYAAQRR